MASAAILAGGRARRFGGRDKSRLLVSGQTILERQLAALRPISDDIMIVGSGPPEAASEVAGVRLVADRIAGCGPLGGLDAALAAARDDRLVVVACDMPYLTAPFLAHLVAQLEDADVVVPRTERGYHPLCAAYTRRCAPAVARRLARGELKLTALLDDLRVRVVDDVDRFGPGARLLANVNTPAELDAVEALVDHEA